jgi:hypothetical protein
VCFRFVAIIDGKEESVRCNCLPFFKIRMLSRHRYSAFTDRFELVSILLKSLHPQISAIRPYAAAKYPTSRHLRSPGWFPRLCATAAVAHKRGNHGDKPSGVYRISPRSDLGYSTDGAANQPSCVEFTLTHLTLAYKISSANARAN